MFKCKICGQSNIPVDDAAVLMSNGTSGICLVCYNRECRIPPAHRSVYKQVKQDIESISVLSAI